MARESSLWDWLSKGRKELGDQLHVTRIENAVSAGMPDVEGYLKLPDCEGQFWLELKSEERPAKPSTLLRFKVRQAQVDWINERWAVGGNVFWLLQVGSGPDRILYLAPGPLGPQLQRGVTESELAIECVRYAIFKAPFHHEAIFKKAVQCRSNQYLFPR